MDVNNDAIDILKEIGNIGSGNASTSLAKLLEGHVKVSVPKCEMASFDTVTHMIGEPETIVTAVLVEIHGDIDGMVMLVQQLGDAIVMTQSITRQRMSVRDLADMDVLLRELSPIEEIGNIVIGTYISSISTMMGLRITPSVPMMTVDMAQAVMSVPASIYGEVGDEVMLLETQFSSDVNKIKGHFFMIPTVDSHQKIVGILNGQRG